MKNVVKRAISLGFILCMCLGLTACFGFNTKDVQDLVQGNLDTIYLGKIDPDYENMVQDSKEELEQAHKLYMNDEYEPLNAFWNKYAEYDFTTMSDEDYIAYTHEYGEIIVQMVRDLIPELGYMEQKSQSIQVEIIDDVQSINEDDFAVFDSYVISYP